MNLMVVCFVILLACIADKILLKLMSKNMRVSRTAQGRRRVYRGEYFQIKTTFENCKKIPIPIAYVIEDCPQGLSYVLDNGDNEIFESDRSVSKYSLNAFEKRSKLVTIKAKERGIYTFSSINTVLGDLLGLYNINIFNNDYVEFVVYPKITHLANYEFKSRSSFGEIPIRNWIYNDNFLIKGIRQYTINDRMKDVHWKVSARMGRLMVKETECTTDRSLMVYLNVGNKGDYDCKLDNNDFEKAIEICASIIVQCNIDGISVGMGTNSNIIMGDSIKTSEILPNQGNKAKLLELCSSIYLSVKFDFGEYIKNNIDRFRIDTTYLFVCKKIKEEDAAMLSFLAMKGIIIYVMDIGSKNEVPYIDGIEIIRFRGEKNYE